MNKRQAKASVQKEREGEQDYTFDNIDRPTELRTVNSSVSTIGRKLLLVSAAESAFPPSTGSTLSAPMTASDLCVNRGADRERERVSERATGLSARFLFPFPFLAH